MEEDGNVTDELRSASIVHSLVPQSPNENRSGEVGVNCPSSTGTHSNPTDVISSSSTLPFSGSSHDENFNKEGTLNDLSSIGSPKNSTNLSSYEVIPLIRHQVRRRSSSYPGSKITDKTSKGRLDLIGRERSESDVEIVDNLEACISKLSLNLDGDNQIFYLIANQLYKQGKHTKVCPMCQEEKKKNNGSDAAAHPKSHIFPRALLDVYSKIHFAESREDFIYDHYTNKYKTANSLTFPLFCEKCENAASREESFLKDLYLQIMGIDHGNHLKITPVYAEMLKHILAVLLFRGMLVGMDFFSEMQKKYFDKLMKTFFELRKFCHIFETHAEDYTKSPISKQLCIFLLPNTHYNPDNIDPTFILDFQLHNPQFASVIELKNKAYLYTKFDCFHGVLPLQDSCDPSLKESSSFLQCKEEKCYLLPSAQEAIQSFPSLLLDYNLQQSKHLIEISSSLNMSSRCVILNLECPPWPRPKPPPVDGSIIAVKRLKETGDEDKLLARALEFSPIARLDPQSTIVKELTKKVKAEEQKSRSYQKEKKEKLLSKLKNEVEYLKKELLSKDAQIENLKEQLKELKEQLKRKNK